MAAAARQFMSPEDLADYLDVPLQTVYAWRYKGTGPRAHRVGRHVRFSLVDVLAWLDAHADRPRAASVTRPTRDEAPTEAGANAICTTTTATPPQRERGLHAG